MPGPESPRTADKCARSSAFLMLTAAQRQTTAIKSDKQWESQWREHERTKVQKEREHSQKIVHRQREVSAQIMARQKELADEEERQKLEVRQQIVESTREHEEVAMTSARRAAMKQAEQYQEHLKEVREQRES